MKIHNEPLSDVDRYIEGHKSISLEEKEPHYRNILRAVKRYRSIDGSSRLLEIGTGMGWLPILCKKDGLQCKGLEISPQLIEFAKQWGAQCGIDPDIELGNIEDMDIGHERYDAIIASNVFEHVERWRDGIAKVYRALKPGGIVFFESTNKFSFTSGEYDFPLYGWLPDQMRYRLRIARQGADIMKLGIDFHQFRHGLLRREFKKAGFSKILDRVQMADENHVSTHWKKVVVRISKSFPPAKALSLTFADATRFICIK
jgi:cyclopropane fatty-acyl-phospholipid synthase-like methyltransferase